MVLFVDTRTYHCTVTVLSDTSEYR